MTLAVMLLGHAVFAQATHQSPSSAAGSPPSDTSAPTNEKAIGACVAAADELAATRKLADALDAENRLLRERLETEKRTSDLLTELNKTRAAETDALRTAIAAKNDALAAKETVIEKQSELIVVLKQKRSSPWRRIGDVLIGAAAALILK